MNLLPFLIFKRLFFFTLCLLSLQAHALTLTLEERAWIEQNPSITLGSDYAWAPYDFVNQQSQHAGISADIINIIRQKTGLDIQIKSGVWAGIMTDMQAGRLDGLVCAVQTPERDVYLSFTPPYTSIPLAIVTRTNQAHIQSMEDLKGRTIGVNKGSYLHEWLKTNYPDIELVLTNSNEQALDFVSFGQVDAYFGNVAVATYVIRQKYLTNLKIVAKVDGLETKTSIAIDKNQPILMSIMQKALADINPKAIRTINERWLFQPQKNMSQGVVLTLEEKQWINSFGAVNVASELDWPPFNFIDDSSQEPQGLALDYLALIAQKTGLKLNITADSWPNNLSDLEYKRADLLPAAVKNKDRERYAIFSTPYFKAKNYFFIRNDLDVKQLSDLDGRTVALPKGFASIPVIQRDYPNILILETTSVQASIEAVLQNKAQLLYGVYPTISYLLRQTGVNSIMPFKATRQASQDIKFMVRKDAPELVSILNKGLAAITPAEKEFIESKWLVQAWGGLPSKMIKLSKEEQQFLQQNPTIRFTGDPDWLPFEAFTENGRYQGIVADFLKHVEKKIPVTFEPIVVESWQDTLALAEQKKVMVISGDVDDTALAKNYRPITPYLTSPIVIVKQGEAEFVSELSSLEPLTLAIVNGYGYTHALFEKYPKHIFQSYDAPMEALESVSSGQSDAALLSLPVASYLIKQHGLYHLKIVGKTSLEMKMTLFVLKELPMLHQVLDKAMIQVKDEKGVDILNTWTKLNFASKVDYWLIFQVLLVALLFVAVVFYWNLKLAREIQQRKAIEQQLETEKDKFKYLFEKAADGHLIYQRNQFVACNQAALDLLGLVDKKALLDQDVTAFSPEYQPDGELSAIKRKQLIQRCFNQGMQRFDWMLKKANGELFWVDVVYASIPYLGKPAIYVSWRDKTEQKALELTLKQNEEQIKLLIENIPLIVIVSGVDGTILSANRKALDDYKMTPKALSELNISRFYQNSNDRKKVHKILRSQGKVNQKIITMRNFHGETREMMVSVIPLKYHNQSAFLTIAVDLTDRILAEKQLKEAMESAEAANHSKTEFLANMSHEIRTPMNAILGFTELLNEQVKEPRLKSFISTIQSAGNTLLMLINDILDLSKIEAGKMTLQQVATNPHELFKEVGDIFAMNIQKKGLDFYIDIDPDIPHSLLLDPVRLRQVLFNLLGNAVKFTETGFVKLSVKSVGVFDHLSKMNLLIRVEDTGIGIPLDQQDRIFNVFEQQSGQDSGKFGGTGLGLSITKRLVGMMKGHLSVESTPNKGSTFSILLEKVDIASVHSHKILDASLAFNANRVRFKHATILVVDDVLNNRELICQNFINSGLDIIEAKNGQEAIDLYKSHRIDLILMDIRMPVLNGYEAAKVIKELNSDVPIIALTASVMQDEFEKIRRAYFDDYLRKPVLRNDLIETLAQFLEYRESGAEEFHEGSNTLDFDVDHLSDSLKETMKIELGALYESALKSNSIEDIKAFAKKVANLSTEQENDSLDRFASQLLEKVDSFDIAGMQFLLKKADFLLE